MLKNYEDLHYQCVRTDLDYPAIDFQTEKEEKQDMTNISHEREIRYGWRWEDMLCESRDTAECSLQGLRQ